MYQTRQIIFILLLFSFYCANLSGQAQYPAAKKIILTDNYFDRSVENPYRWLENDNSGETKTWVKKQNIFTGNYPPTILYRDKVKKRLHEKWNYSKYSSPVKQGTHNYYFKDDGLQNQSALYRQTRLYGNPEILIDPNSPCKDGTTERGVPVFTKAEKYCAYLRAQMDLARSKYYGCKTKG